MQPLRIIELESLADRDPAGALVANVDLVIVRYDDEVSVMFGRCLHRGALMCDGKVVGTRTSWPYTTFTWTNVVPGRHEIAVRVRDIYGLSTLTAPVTIHMR